MSSIFEQAQQLFVEELNFWTDQVRSYTDLVAREAEANLKLAQQTVTHGQATLERLAKKGDGLRRELDTRTTALVNKLTELKAA